MQRPRSPRRKGRIMSADNVNDRALQTAGDEYETWYHLMLDAATLGLDKTFWLAVGERARIREQLEQRVELNGGDNGTKQQSISG